MRAVWKKVCSLTCLILVLLSAVLPVGAEETANTEDSVTVPENVLACLNAQTIDTIFCVYNFGSQFVSCSYDGFVLYGDIDGMLANVTEPELQRYYFVKDKSGETTVYTYDGTSLSEERYIGGSGWFDIHSEQAASIIQKIHAGVVVENIYYLWYPTWIAVYYRTNLGDYVYVMSGQKEYLMGLKPFLLMQEELYELGIKYKDWRDMDNQPYQIKLGEVRADLSPYDITSPDFDPHAPLEIKKHAPGRLIAIGSFVLLLTLIVCRYWIRGHKKYREKKEKMAYRI